MTTTSYKIAFIEHYDSFSYNVLDWLVRAGLNANKVLIARCDQNEDLAYVKNLQIPLVLSPGPHHPKDVPLSLELIKSLIGKVPILGVCLGHQLLGYCDGADVVPAKEPWHGAQQKIRILKQEAIFAGLPAEINVACYNSLTVDRASLEKISTWTILAENRHGEVMAMKKNDADVATWSVQFHPESFMSEGCQQIAKNWLSSWTSS